jgi:hypothetical protein
MAGSSGGSCEVSFFFFILIYFFYLAKVPSS